MHDGGPDPYSIAHVGFGAASSAIPDACRLLSERSLDPMIVFDGTLRCVAANSAALDLLEYEHAEFLQCCLTDLVADLPSDEGSPRLLSASEWSGTISVRRKRGALLHAEAWFTELSDASGTAILMFLRDAGRRGEIVPPAMAPAEAALPTPDVRPVDSAGAVPDTSPPSPADHVAKDATFRAAFIAASIGMALISPNGDILTVNPALCTMLGYSEDQLLDLSFPSITYVEDLESDRDLVRQLLAGDIDSYQIEKRFLRQHGETIWGRLTVGLVRDLADSALALVAQIQDITPYKAFGTALREAEARYRTLVEQIPAVLYIDDGHALGNPVYISPQIESLLGFTPEEWLKTPGYWFSRLHPDDLEPVRAALLAAGASGESVHLEYRYIARDGDTVWVRDQLALVRDETGAPRYWQGFMVDISARKRAEAELRAALSAAEEANRLKSAFLSMATHELRTPLTVISGYVELLADTASARLGTEEQEFLDIVRTSAKTLAALVDDLLDLARIEAGRMELVVRPVNVAEVVERVRRMVAPQARSKGVALEVDVAPGLPAVAADVNRIIQVLLNLFGNAVKFTEVGSVRCVVRPRRGGVEIAVIDTGIGITADALPRIFDEFRQADAGTTRKFGGSGLGLAIAKRLVDMQSGTITARSKVGEGSTFTIWLPVATPQLIHDDRVALESSAVSRHSLLPN